MVKLFLHFLTWIKILTFFEKTLITTYKAARRLVITIIGITVILVGVVMIITPGPAIVVIPAGLAILSLEFAWARLLLRKFKKTTGNMVNGLKRQMNNKTDSDTKP